MSDRLRNNVIALGIVVCFWIIFVLPVMAADPIVTQSTSTSTVDNTTNTKTRVLTNPPSAISPSINSSNSDLCVVGVSGAVQTMILGASFGKTVVDTNCERLKLSKLLFDLGMKVSAVSILCQDERVHRAMKNSGTPCPIFDEATGEGLIGKEAQKVWDLNPKLIPEAKNEPLNKGAWLEKLASGIISVILLALLVAG
jgi:hypothetical protein